MSQLTDGWITHLRNTSRQDSKATSRQGSTNESLVTCQRCKAEVPHDIAKFRQHVLENAVDHGSPTEEELKKEFDGMTLSPSFKNPTRPGTRQDQVHASTNRKRPGPGTVGADDTRHTAMNSDRDGQREPKKVRSPTFAEAEPRVRPRPSSQTPRSRARQTDSDFDRGTRRNPPSRPLFDPQSDLASGKSKGSGQPRQGQSRQLQRKQQPPSSTQQPPHDASDSFDGKIDPNRPHTSITPQPKTKPISQEQLVAEVKGIYAGLVMIEGKCIEVDNSQSQDDSTKLTEEQWTAVVCLHRTLLHEHHDFFLASQHPSANISLRRLASKYAMPARMWRHGIHSFLELLRHNLPASYDHMLTFIYTAYSMMALLYETVPAFEDTWIECLGDLARYRMAIEETDLKDREIWTGVARHWYSLASEKAPTTGRLYHHLAILARPNAIQQLCFYTKSLCVPIPFASARESIMTLFDPIFTSQSSRLSQIDTAFVKAHGILFSKTHMDQLHSAMEEYISLLDEHIGRVAKRWLEIGHNTAIPLTCALMGYGEQSHFFFKLVSSHTTDSQAREGDTSAASEIQPSQEPDETFGLVKQFAMRIYEIVVRRWGDPNTLPFIHTFLVFMYHVSCSPGAMKHLEKDFPWELTAVMLNFLYHTCKSEIRIDSEVFPGPLKNDSPRPLVEDFKMHGLLYTEKYFPAYWFKDSQVEEDEKEFELLSMIDQRKERILWLGRRLARSGEWLTWNEDSRKFGVAEAFASGAEDITLEAVLSAEQQKVDALAERDLCPA